MFCTNSRVIKVQKAATIERRSHVPLLEKSATVTLEGTKCPIANLPPSYSVQCDLCLALERIYIPTYPCSHCALIDVDVTSMLLKCRFWKRSPLVAFCTCSTLISM